MCVSVVGHCAFVRTKINASNGNAEEQQQQKKSRNKNQQLLSNGMLWQC